MKDFEDTMCEELDEQEFAEVDALIECLATLPCHETHIVNPIKVQQVRFACAQINHVLKEVGSKAKIECKQHEFNANVAVVRVEGVSLEIADAEGFARAAEFATNTEIYPLTNGNVRMTFTFHGLLIPV